MTHQQFDDSIWEDLVDHLGLQVGIFQEPKLPPETGHNFIQKEPRYYETFSPYQSIMRSSLYNDFKT